MVFAINPPVAPSPNTFAAFQALANATTTTATAYVTPPPPTPVTETVTVTFGTSVWTTTYASYDGTPRMFYLHFSLTAATYNGLSSSYTCRAAC
jgi:hypothetical protein